MATASEANELIDKLFRGNTVGDAARGLTPSVEVARLAAADRVVVESTPAVGTSGSAKQPTGSQQPQASRRIQPTALSGGIAAAAAPPGGGAAPKRLTPTPISSAVPATAPSFLSGSMEPPGSKRIKLAPNPIVQQQPQGTAAPTAAAAAAAASAAGTLTRPDQQQRQLVSLPMQLLPPPTVVVSPSTSVLLPNGVKVVLTAENGKRIDAKGGPASLLRCSRDQEVQRLTIILQ